jgi:hypothetical protein
MCSLPGAHCRDLLSRVAALSVRRVQSIRQGQQQPPAYSFPRALLFGGGAALAGCAIYAIVAIASYGDRAHRHSGRGHGRQGDPPSLGRVWRKIATDSCRGADLILIFHRHQLHPGYNKGSGA